MTRLLLAAMLTAMLTAAAAFPQTERALLNQYCTGCHNEKLKTGGLMLDKLDLDQAGANPEVWEKVVRKLQAGMMPPAGAARPDRKTMDGLVEKIEAQL